MPLFQCRYLVLGVEHILLGIDHLLFVLALFILVKGTARLIATVTAFTVAHSLTLAGATLGFLLVPGPPVEAGIALSIVFVAAEIVHSRQGRDRSYGEISAFWRRPRTSLRAADHTIESGAAAAAPAPNPNSRSGDGSQQAAPAGRSDCGSLG